MEESFISNNASSEAVGQLLVRLADVTHVIDLPPSKDNELCRSHVLEMCSRRTGWPLQTLRITNWAPPFCSVRVVSCIRGGKGGFGTLLKGLSKQAGAKMTTDFGACRDLQGRRLRHVNDEIKLRRWRELQQRKAAGEDVNELSEMLQTPTGLYNWYLLTPNWAGLSGKGTRKVQRQMKRQFRQWQSEEEQAKDAKRMRDEEYHQTVAYYVNQTMTVADMIQKSTAEAVLQGMMAAKQQKQQRQKKNNATYETVSERNPPVDESSKQQAPAEESAVGSSEDQQSESLLTLTGEVVIAKSETTPMEIQSKSEFSTVAFVLDNVPENTTLYYEIKLVTGGLAQVGWAAMTEQEFRPNNETGDGVGDDAGSFGYDGSRGVKFHKGKDERYGPAFWQAGDVVGCLYNSSTGQISYSLNGSDLGMAFATTSMTCPLVPALSCNLDEILELRIHANEMQHQPNDSLPVGNLLVSTASSGDQNQRQALAPSNGDMAAVAEQPQAPPPQSEKEEAEQEKKLNDDQQTSTKIGAAVELKEVEPPVTSDPVKAEPLELDAFDSAKELEELGLDRLKGALMALGVKCG
jgi:hypothetical protein